MPAIPQSNERPRKWGRILMFIVVIWILATITALILLGNAGKQEAANANVAVIAVKGVITGDSSDDFFSSSVASSSQIVATIDQVEQMPNIKAIILEINSPGGSAVASEEIARKVKESKIPVVAWVREIGTSGAYWVASSSDTIVASPVSITGSVGVIGSYLNFGGLLENYNITYERMVAGKYKDLGSPLREMKPEERALLQKKLDFMHDYFLKSVVESRKLSPQQTEQVKTALFFTGQEAKDLGLVDVLGGRQEAIAAAEKYINATATLHEFKREKTIFDLFAQASASSFFHVGQGIGDAMMTRTEQNSLTIST
ncbi:signal peptide peptidase SppA [Candidatus Woesearchaeota archaeon]|nr:signal peptide peptidase SppA [Candidatus Woesearchaeota archaeon]